jgi:Fe-S cluster biogenesis protein NfuA
MTTIEGNYIYYKGCCYLRTQGRDKSLTYLFLPYYNIVKILFCGLEAVMDKIKQIIEEKIRPVLKAHQGDLELVEVTADGFVKVKLLGACANCPSAQTTLSEIVEAELQQACPEIKGVIPVSQVSEELINQALKILRKGNN